MSRPSEVPIVPLHGLVLAGGNSRRMGHDKTALRIHGRTQAEHVISLLSAFCETVFVSVRPDQDTDPRFAAQPRIHDLHPGSGPLGAIVSAQKHMPDVAWLVLACDLPFVDENVLSRLLAHRNAGRAVTCYRSTHDNLPEPLCAIYEPESAVILKDYFADGCRCPRKVLINSDKQELEQPFPWALDNVNTPQDLDSAIERLRTDRAALP
ncbi:MAG: NTP transferase domain-containing protein [Pseudomonadales bacterium]